MNAILRGGGAGPLELLPEVAERMTVDLRALIVGGVALVWLGLLPGLASAASVTLNPASFTFTDAADLGVDSQGFNPLAVPYSGSETATDGGSSNTTSFDLSNAGFDLTFAHTRTGVLNAVASSYGEIFFSVDAAVDYAITGEYAASDADGRMMIQYVALQKLGGANLYISYQESRATPNQSFTLGNEDGDEFNILTGSPTGTLDAGDIYRLIFHDAIEASPSAASGSASASGFLTITLTPEPATAFLLGLGLVGLGMARRRAIRG